MAGAASPDDDDLPVAATAPSSPTTVDSFVRKVARIETQSQSPMPVPGLVLGENYELVERIGGGGMGIVFRARDRRLGRDVAVKLLKGGGSGDDDTAGHMRRLFEREARATAQLLHPNIVTLHHVGEHDGAPFLVLELLSGETLAARLARKGRLPAIEALEILDGVLAALAFAHERGVLHRDLKPNNVFITGDERVKVLDFGVAVTLDTDPGPVTRSAGTPGYMAPEHRDGELQDARTDVWAAALLLVECFSGRRPPIDASTVVGRAAHASTMEMGSDVPREVRAVIDRALSRDREKRPETAGELRALLSQAARKLSRPVMRPRRRWMWTASIIAAVGLICGGVAWWLRGMTSDDGLSRFDRGVLADEVRGMWASEVFGTMYLDVAADGGVRGAYSHDDGVLAGTFADGVIRGWWCEKPTHRPPADAGALELRFVREERGLRIDGRWRYGGDETATWHDDWDAFRVGSRADPNLAQRVQSHPGCARNE